MARMGKKSERERHFRVRREREASDSLHGLSYRAAALTLSDWGNAGIIIENKDWDCWFGAEDTAKLGGTVQQEAEMWGLRCSCLYCDGAGSFLYGVHSVTGSPRCQRYSSTLALWPFLLVSTQCDQWGQVSAGLQSDLPFTMGWVWKI